MKQAITTLRVPNQGAGLYEFTRELKDWVRSTGLQDGLLTVFCRHTSASLTIQENADPDVLEDLQAYFKNLVPQSDHLYRHSQEGLDDMPAHIRTVLTDVSLSIPVMGGATVLGTWQGVFLFEHRNNRQDREVVLHILGD
ncbi:MAG: YjbQ family protein [Magnetovibrio sp.]|nr:YjbQ family protein [Magnetovibrio sp.]